MDQNTPMLPTFADGAATTSVADAPIQYPADAMR